MPDRQLFNQACDTFDDGNIQAAIAGFDAAARQGDLEAMERLASLYAEGEGIAENHDQSIQWGLRAVEAGSVPALTQLGLSHRALGDHAVSARWLEKAVAAGDGDAAYELAKTYLEMEGGSALAIDLLFQAVNSETISYQALNNAIRLLRECSHD